MACLSQQHRENDGLPRQVRGLSNDGVGRQVGRRSDDDPAHVVADAGGDERGVRQPADAGRDVDALIDQAHRAVQQQPRGQEGMVVEEIVEACRGSAER